MVVVVEVQLGWRSGVVVDSVAGLEPVPSWVDEAEEVLVVWDCGTHWWTAPGPRSESWIELQFVVVTGIEFVADPDPRSCLTPGVLVSLQALVVLAVPSVFAVVSSAPLAAPFVVAHVFVACSPAVVVV